ncbi:MAG: SDR family oxidoreductase [Gaiellales bacterium]
MTVAEPRVAIVTGGASGIGRASAIRLARDGYRVVIGDRDASALALVAASPDVQTAEMRFVEGDVADPQASVRLAETAIATWGRIDVLVASAGLQLEATLLETTPTDWDDVLGVNLKGVAFACAAVLPQMRAQGEGAIVAISSLNAVVGTGHMAAYDASKAGVVALVRSIAISYGRDGIRANAVGPGATITEFHLRAAAARGIGPGELRSLDYGLLGRPAEPEEIAAVVSFLAGSDASNVTGQLLLADGGASVGARS